MQLSVVISKAGKGEARITSDTSLDDIVRFLTLLGVNGWELYNKGTTRLEVNRSDLYVAIGPLSVKDLCKFLKQARSFVDT